MSNPNWLDLSGTSNRYVQMYVKGFVDVSGGNITLRPGITNNNHLIVQGGDISLNGRLFVSKDASINGITVGMGGGAISSNTVFGNAALQINTTGVSNCAFGYNALTLNTTGQANCAFGQYALASNTTSESNSAFGHDALAYNTTGIYNNGFGRAAIKFNTTGNSNNAVGQAALRNNTTGSANTAIGSQAGFNNVLDACSYNTFLGATTDLDAATNAWTKSTAIGYNAKITASNQIVLGTASETVSIPGSLGFATTATSTTYKPFIMRDNPILLRQGSDTNHGLVHGNSFYPNGTSTFGIDGPALYGFGGGMLGTNVNGTLNAALTWKSSGNVGIGTNNPQSALQIFGGTASTNFTGLTITSNGNTADTYGQRLLFNILNPIYGYYDQAMISTYRENNADNYNSSLLFSVTSGGNATLSERMRITSSGNVGIGTTNPQYKLDVATNNFGFTITGGSPTYSYYDVYTIASFTTPGTYIFTPSVSMKIGYVVVGGGGGGGCNTENAANGGSGGATAYSTLANGPTLVAGRAYTITVGQGGEGATQPGNNGGPAYSSYISGDGLTTITGTRGLGGYIGIQSAATVAVTATGGTVNLTSGVGCPTQTGLGGAGPSFTISDINKTYQFGGGGGAGWWSTGVGFQSNLQSGGGGGSGTAGLQGNNASTGGVNGLTTSGGNGAPNTGGGGGGTTNLVGTYGGNGGSGIVILYFNTNKTNILGGMSIMSSSVGIGTTAPEYELDVNGIIRANKYITAGGGYITSGIDGYITAGNGDDRSVPQKGVLRVGGHFATGTFLQIQKIGTMTWGSQALYNATRYISCTGNAEHTKDFNVGPGGVGIGYAPPVYTKSGLHGLYVNGFVGIGTDNPLFTLDVSGTIRSNSRTYLTGDKILASTAGSQSTSILTVGSGISDHFGALKFIGNRTAAGADWLTSSLRIQKYVDSTNMGYMEFGALGGNQDIAFGNNGNERMRITAAGNVGIGTTNPTGSTMQIGSAGILRLGPAGNIGNANAANGAETSRYQIAFSTYRDVVQDHIGAKIAAINYNIYPTGNPLVQSTALAFFVNPGSDVLVNNYPTFSGTNTSGTPADSSTEAMRITPEGNVGIGTNNPQYTLDVIGNMRLNGGFASTGIFQGPTQLFSVNTSGVTWNTAAIGTYIASNAGTGGGYPGGLFFQTKSPDSTTTSQPITRMVIDSNGNVGIGTNHPLSPLHVNKPEPGVILRLSVYGAYRNEIGVGDEPNLFRINARGNSDEYGNIALATNNVDRLIITNTGNVGIGTTNPSSYKLDVAGQINSSAGGVSFTANNASYSQYGTNSAYPTNRFNTIAAGDGVYALINANGGLYVAGQGLTLTGQSLYWGSQTNTAPTSFASQIQIDGGRSAFAGVNHGQIRFYTANVQQMTINESGNVGIGTTNPSCALDVAGSMKLQRKIPLLVAVGQGTNTIATSTDGGITWTGRGQTIFTTAGNAATWNGTMWVALGQGTNTIAISTDGIYWTGRGQTIFTTQGKNAAWNGTMWVAVGQGTNSFATSTDGITWTGRGGTTIFSTSGICVAWNGTMWVAGGIGTNTFATSTNGIDWTARGSGGGAITSYVLCVAWNGTMWVAGGGMSNPIATSTNGIDWTGRAASIMGTGRGVAWNGTMWVAVGGGANSFATSTDGLTWTARGGTSIFSDGQTVVWTGTMWVAVGQNANTIATSPNGIDWTARGATIFSSVGIGVGFAVLDSNATLSMNSSTRNQLDVAGSLGISGTTTFPGSTTINSSGYVGIGTTSPGAILDVRGTVAGSTPGGGYSITGTGGAGRFGGAGFNASIYANNDIVASGWFVAGSGTVTLSDKRIKNNINNIDSAISKLRMLIPRHYEYIDKIKMPKATNGFIAQEVKSVIPEAVNVSTEYIPNIYDFADVSNNIITLKTKTTDTFLLDDSGNLLTNIKVYDNNKDVRCKIVSIIDNHSFTIDEAVTSDVIFAYGQEVTDLLSLEKDSIFTITTAAVQQIDTTVQEQQQTIQTLETRLAALDARLSAAGF
jgi:hypothetical protein